MISTYKIYTDTHWYLFRSEYIFRRIELSLTYECPNHDSVRHVNSSWIEFSLSIIWNSKMTTDGIIPSNPVSQAEKGHLKSCKQWEHNIQIYCILNAEVNIILLDWNKQHCESGIIQWGCRLLDENFYLVLMITCVAMQICHMVGRWAIWYTTWCKI